MCLAPRYMSGPIAAPRINRRNSASLPETPCALASGASTIARNATVRRATRPKGVAESSVAQPFRGAQRPLAGLKACATSGHRRSCEALLGTAFVFLVTGIAGFIDGLARFEHFVGALRLSRSQNDFPGVNHRLRHPDPVAFVDR